jgi:hypothetical protein
MDSASQVKARAIAIAGTNVLEIATAMAEEIIAIGDWYGRRFPYDKGKLIRDIGVLLMYGMSDRIAIEFFIMVNNEKVEKLSYTYFPGSDTAEVNGTPGEFPRYAIEPEWQVRVVSYYTTTKPVSEVREFHNQLGWPPVDMLTRTGEGTTERYGEFRSGDLRVLREVYIARQNKAQTERKESRAHEII